MSAGQFNLCSYALQDGVFFKVVQRKAISRAFNLFSKECTPLEDCNNSYLFSYDERKKMFLPKIHIFKPILKKSELERIKKAFKIYSKSKSKFELPFEETQYENNQKIKIKK